MEHDTHKKSILKSVIWRILGVLVLAAVVYFFTRKWITTSLITIIHHGTFLVVFYLHERLWFKIKKFVGKTRRIIKAFTYEIILGMGLGGLIVLLVTGQWSKVTQITITYTIIKLIMYYFYEKAWTYKIVYAYMVGDIIHIGHLRALENAKKQGNYLVVGVLTDEAVTEKKPKPIIPFRERIKTIAAIKYVNEVLPQFNYSPLKNVEVIRPDVLMESDNHEEQPANNFVRSYGGKVVITPYYKIQSSTKIKNRIIEKNKH